MMLVAYETHIPLEQVEMMDIDLFTYWLAFIKLKGERDKPPKTKQGSQNQQTKPRRGK